MARDGGWVLESTIVCDMQEYITPERAARAFTADKRRKPRPDELYEAVQFGTRRCVQHVLHKMVRDGDAIRRDAGNDHEYRAVRKSNEGAQ